MLTLVCYTAQLYGKEPNETLPSKALLEYLSELQEVKGELISPIDMLDIDDVDLPIEVNKLPSAIKQIDPKKSQKIVPKVVQKELQQ
jgi:hypothetical protein